MHLCNTTAHAGAEEQSRLMQNFPLYAGEREQYSLLRAIAQQPSAVNYVPCGAVGRLLCILSPIKRKKKKSKSRRRDQHPSFVCRALLSVHIARAVREITTSAIEGHPIERECALQSQPLKICGSTDSGYISCAISEGSNKSEHGRPITPSGQKGTVRVKIS